jgi:hypothetical protein
MAKWRYIVRLALLTAMPIHQAAGEAPAPGNLGEALYYAGAAASGSRLCDREQSARYVMQFSRRYGERIRALMQVHIEHFGEDPGFIFTTSCNRMIGSSRAQDRHHARAMDAFEPTLRQLERRFGGY